MLQNLGWVGLNKSFVRVDEYVEIQLSTGSDGKINTLVVIPEWDQNGHDAELKDAYRHLIIFVLVVMDFFSRHSPETHNLPHMLYFRVNTSNGQKPFTWQWQVREVFAFLYAVVRGEVRIPPGMAVIGFFYKLERKTRMASKCTPERMWPHFVPHIVDYTAFTDPNGDNTDFLPYQDDPAFGYAINRNYSTEAHKLVALHNPILQTTSEGDFVIVVPTVAGNMEVPNDTSNMDVHIGTHTTLQPLNI